MSRPHRHWNADDLFALWYNGGARRRTHTETAAAWAEAHPGEEAPSVKVVERYSGEDDWKGRAQRLDAEARKLSDRRLAEMIARHRESTLKVAAHVMTLYASRFLLPEGDPARLDAKDVNHGQWAASARIFELLTGGTTERHDVEEETTLPLDAIEAELEEIEIRALQREAERTPAAREPLPLPPVLDAEARRIVRNPSVSAGC